jgi:hypothetical protein
MSAYHCACGFAVNDADEFGDHLREVFDLTDTTGTDGLVHDEVMTSPDRQRLIVCACGFETASIPEFDDHVLRVLLPPDGMGKDGQKHVLVDPSTPVRYFVPREPPA